MIAHKLAVVGGAIIVGYAIAGLRGIMIGAGIAFVIVGISGWRRR